VRQILELLERDATLTPDTLATMLGLPVEDVRTQITAWERSGAIRRYRAVVDWDVVDDDPVPVFTRHLEAAFETMWTRHQQGEPPASFAVARTG